MASLEADYDDSSFPLELVVNVAGVGGISGLVCTVAVRESTTTNSYLDWSTNTFKTSGWGVKNQPMTDLGTGVYQAELSVAALGFTPMTGLPVYLVAEYTSFGVGTSGLAIDYVTVSELRPDAKLSRQYNTNKLTSLAPGVLTLYEDDGSTVQSAQTLTDAVGNPTVNVPTAPQIRGPVS